MPNGQKTAPPNAQTSREASTPAIENIVVTSSVILPGDVPRPCPELLTEEEALRYLRLDLIDVEDPAGTLRYYRRQGLLRGTQVGKCVRYRRIELERLLERLTDTNPR